MYLTSITVGLFNIVCSLLSSFMAKDRKQTPAPPLAALSIPRNPSATSLPTSPTTPKTPADEGIEFFESSAKPGDSPIRVYELRLDPDGGPNRERRVRLSCSLSVFAVFNNTSISVFRQRMCLTYFVFLWTQECQLPRTVFSRRTFL
jgi:hypothetical protein